MIVRDWVFRTRRPDSVYSESVSRFAKWIRCAFGTCLVITGCNEVPVGQITSLDNRPSISLENEIQTFCGACHVVPLPEMFPKSMWYAEVRRGYEFYYQTYRQDLKVPIQAEVVDYFRERAPQKLEFKQSETATPSPIKFRIQPLVLELKNSTPAISFAAWSESTLERGRLRVSDMANGEINFIEPWTSFVRSLKTSTSNPAASCVCDLDLDGNLDLVIADLGSFLPEDHDLGKVVWIAGALREGREKETTILENVGRVADVCAADFDGDGDEDLVVAEFGWHRTGGIHLIANEGNDPVTNKQRFRSEKLDSRAGTIHVRPIDLNRDGRMDFVALISQEFEVVVAFLNLPEGFQKTTIFAAPDPSFGSSGIEIIDFDRDGDMDVLYTNGDTFDSSVIKPFHSIKWLENQGTFPFMVHEIATMPGVHRARAADLDGDGDFDIVAAAIIPKKLFQSAPEIPLDAIVWFEQTDAKTFVRHVLKTGTPIHTTIEVADMDDDGDIDIAASGFYFEAEAEHPEIIMFWNDGRIDP